MGGDARHTAFVKAGPTLPLEFSWKALSGAPGDSFTAWPVVFDSTVYASSGPGLLAVDARTGQRRWWKNYTEGALQTAPVVSSKAVYVAIGGGRLIALDRKSGDELWRFQAPPVGELDTTMNASPLLWGSRIFVGAGNSKRFYAISTDSGKLLWELETDEEPHGIPTVSKGIVIFATLGSPNNTYYAVEATTGKVIWTKKVLGDSSSAAILGNKVVLIGGDLFAHAWDLQTGKQIWRSRVEGRSATWSMPAIADGDVFLADWTGNLYRLDGDTGRRKWIFRDTVGTTVQSFPVIAGNYLYIGTGAGWLYGLDIRNGELLWKEQVKTNVLSGAADSKHFYFGSKFHDEGLYAYEHDPNGLTIPQRKARITAIVIATCLVSAALAVVLWRKRRRQKSKMKDSDTRSKSWA